jgi:hypothetical protein
VSTVLIGEREKREREREEREREERQREREKWDETRRDNENKIIGRRFSSDESSALYLASLLFAVGVCLLLAAEEKEHTRLLFFGPLLPFYPETSHELHTNTDSPLPPQ